MQSVGIAQRCTVSDVITNKHGKQHMDAGDGKLMTL